MLFYWMTYYQIIIIRLLYEALDCFNEYYQTSDVKMFTFASQCLTERHDLQSERYGTFEVNRFLLISWI